MPTLEYCRISSNIPQWSSYIVINKCKFQISCTRAGLEVAVIERVHRVISFWWTSQPVRFVDPHLVTTFHNSYAQADLWVTTELVNTSSAQVTVTVKLNVSLDDADEFCIIDHVHTSQDIVIEGNSTMPYSLPPVIFLIE